MQIETSQITQQLLSTEDLVEKTIAEICGFKNTDCLLSQALEHHFQSGGSRTRANLTYKFSKNFLIPEGSAVYLACIPELLHNASLIHDDLQDLDEERRDNVSVWKKYGSDIAICAGDFLISSAYGCIGNLDLKDGRLLTKHLHDFVQRVIRGQIGDLTQDKNQTLVDLDLYQKISKEKSGPLLAMSITLPLIYTNRLSYLESAEQAFYDYAIAYQIHDDIHDIEQDQAKEGIKSGLNIVTIMQKNGEQSPLKAACDLALEKLKSSQLNCSKLPFPSNAILEKEIYEMQRRISFIGKH